MRVGADTIYRTFVRQKQNKRFFVSFGVFTPSFMLIRASAGGASKNFIAFCLQTAYDVIIFKFQGGASAPPCTPLPAPMFVHAAPMSICKRYNV